VSAESPAAGAGGTVLCESMPAVRSEVGMGGGALTREKLTPEQEVEIILTMGPVWQALGKALSKLVRKGIGWETRFSAATGEFYIRFYREKAEDK